MFSLRILVFVDAKVNVFISPDTISALCVKVREKRSEI